MRCKILWEIIETQYLCQICYIKNVTNLFDQDLKKKKNNVHLVEKRPMQLCSKLKSNSVVTTSRLTHFIYMLNLCMHFKLQDI